MAIFQEDLTALTAELVAIDSTNPDLVPGGAGEAEIARFVAGWLERAGLDVEVHDLGSSRANVIAIARGSGGGRSLMLNAHMDVVGAGGMDEPWTPRIDGTRLYGRGAYDMKASLAAIMLAGREAARLQLRGDVIVTAVADEEFASIGVQDVVRHLRADAAIVTEPTGLDLCVAHKGFVWLEVETRGVASHGSLPEEGIDAIAKMGPVLTGLAELDRELRSRPGHALLGPASIHASLIQGGQELSTYPAAVCSRSSGARSPGKRSPRSKARSRTFSSGPVPLTPHFRLSSAPSSCAPRSAWVWINRLSTSRNGISPARLAGNRRSWEPAGGWIRRSLPPRAFPTVIFGPDGEGAHADVEWVDLVSATRTADALLGIIVEFCA